MSNHIALYNAYRPLEFSDLVGQESLVKILTNSLQRNRVSHAYLFCGSRGTGKTTAARIFAKALNCESGLGNVCMKCKNCVGITEGTSSDVLEIDGASNGGIETIRNVVIERAKFKPSGRYRIFIIDEVHMLSNGAFNALLKILEEPPEHVIFIFATTDPQKVLNTIMSRVQRFDLNNMTMDNLVDRMKYISDAESISVDADILYMIAKYAKGGMRDAINMLDQLSSFNEGVILRDDAISVLGMVDEEVLLEIIDSVCNKDIKPIIDSVDSIIGSGKNVSLFYDELINLFDCLQKINVGIDVKKQITSNSFSDEFIEKLNEYKGKLKTNEIVKTVKLLIENERKVKFGSNKQLSIINVFNESMFLSSGSSSNAKIPYMDELIKRVDELERIIQSGDFGGKRKEVESIVSDIKSKIMAKDVSDDSTIEEAETIIVEYEGRNELLFFLLNKINGEVVM